jgi:hypothetical protein
LRHRGTAAGKQFNKRTPVPGAEQAAPFPPTLILKPGEKPF